MTASSTNMDEWTDVGFEQHFFQFILSRHKEIEEASEHKSYK